MLIAIARQKAKLQLSSGSIESIQEQINHVKNMLMYLYVDYKDGIISVDEYQYSDINTKKILPILKGEDFSAYDDEKRKICLPLSL